MIGLLDKATDNAQRDSLFKIAVISAQSPSAPRQPRGIIHNSYFNDAQIMRLAHFLGVNQPEDKTVADILQTPCKSAKKQAVLRTVRLFAYGFISAMTTLRYLKHFCEQKQQRFGRLLPNHRTQALFQFVEAFKQNCLKEMALEKSDALSRLNQRRKPTETLNVLPAHYGSELREQFRSIFHC